MVDETTTEQLAEIEGQAEPQPEPEPVQVREGWWRTRGGEVYEIQRMHESQSNLIAEGYAWKDTSNTHSWCNDGSLWNDGEQSNDDLVEYCGLIKPEPQQVNDWPSVRELRHELKTVQNQLAAVKAELASVAADRYRLQIELDAAQQVPQAIADRFEEGWNQGTARAVEAVLAWLEPIRLADSAYLANATMQHLPSIMRHLTGLAQD